MDCRVERRFKTIYVKFESLKDCAFNLEVTFPKDEEFIKFKQLNEERNM